MREASDFDLLTTLVTANTMWTVLLHVQRLVTLLQQVLNRDVGAHLRYFFCDPHLCCMHWIMEVLNRATKSSVVYICNRIIGA